MMVVNTSGMPSGERITFKHQLAMNQYITNVSMCSTPPGESLFTFGLVLPGAAGDDDKRLTFYKAGLNSSEWMQDFVGWA